MVKTGPKHLKERLDDNCEIVEPGGCWIWMGGLCHGGYGCMNIGSRTDGSRRTVNAHRVSWEVHYGPIPDGLFVLHRCDNKSCVNPSHLFLGTHSDNMADMVAKGRSLSGEKHNLAKLTDKDVAEIRSLGKTTIHRKIAKRFGVSRTHVGALINGTYRAGKITRPRAYQPSASDSRAIR